MSDLISRQDVLDVFRNLAFDHIFQCGEYYGEDERQLTIINAEKAIDVIESLPSAEPERTQWNMMLDPYDESSSPKEKGYYRIIDIYGNEMTDIFFGEPKLTKHGIAYWATCEFPIVAWKEVTDEDAR